MRRGEGYLYTPVWINAADGMRRVVGFIIATISAENKIFMYFKFDETLISDFNFDILILKQTFSRMASVDQTHLLSWWRREAARRENWLVIDPPMAGVTDDPGAEAARLLAEYTGG